MKGDKKTKRKSPRPPGVREVQQNITERKRAEEALKKSEERFHTSVETLLEGFAILSAVRESNGQIIDFKYEYINEAGCKMNQKPLEEHMGKTLLELLPTHKEIGLFDEYVRVVETGQSLTKEFLIYETVYGSGKRLRQAFDVRITRLGDGFVTTWQDITDKKKGEELLRQSEERLKLLLENSKDVIIMANLEGSIIYYNGPPEYGITAEQVLGKNLFSIFDPVIASRLMNQLKRVIKGGEALTFENNIPWKGESFWFLNQMYPIWDKKGRMIGVGVIARNITERKRAEKELRERKEFTENLIASMQDGFSVLDSHGVHIDVNPAFCQMTGFSREELIGVGTPHRYWPPEAYEEIEKAFQKTLRGDFGDVELTFMRKNGERFPVIVSPSWIKDEQGNVTSYFATVKDITERKQAEEALKKSVQLLRDTGEMAKVGGWELDLSTKEVSWTEEVGRIHGVEPGYKPKLEEAIKFYAPESRPDVEAVVKKAAETGEPYDLESLFIPSGSKDKIWVRSLGRAVYIGGKIVKLVGTFQNIDKYKRAEANVRERMKELQALYGLAEMAQREGITLEELYKESTNILLKSLLYAEIACARLVIGDREFRTENFAESPWMQSAPIMVNRKVVGRIEVGYLEERPEGGEGPFLKEERLLIGAVAERLGHITERKRAEEALRRKSGEQALLLDNIQTQIWYLTDRETYGAVNKARAEFFGKNKEEMENKKVYDVLTKGEAEICMSGYDEVFEKRKQIYTEEWIANAKGEKRLLSIIKSPKLDENGEVEYVVCSAEDITERKRTEKERDQLFEQVHASRERLRNLTRRLVEVQEVERRGLVRKLHDEVGQSLTALSINLNIVNNQLPPEMATKMATRIDDSLKLVEETVERIRDVMAELRPPVLDDYGLMAALNWYGKQFSERTGIATVLEGEELIPRLPLATETALFRITQEALTNVAKHGQAKQVIISLKSEEEKVYLTIADDGIGFEQQQQQQQQQQWGLINMRERAQAVGGTLNIETAPGKGTKVVVEIPKIT